MEEVLKFIHSLASLSENSIRALLPALSTKKFKKGALLLKEGQVCNSLFYIEAGYCKSCYDLEGLEKNTFFFFEQDIATNLSSFGNAQPSAYNIRACEPLTAVVFDKQKLFEAARLHPEIDTLGKNCIRRFATRQEEFANLFKLFSAKERLEYLERHHPLMLQRVSLTQLSSFLGVARETLSRIRKKRS
jgi:CRP-like cAMP-binding protein